MTKEQQIEELTMLLFNKAENYCNADGEIIPNMIADTLYDAGYRKVPKGAVILSPEERDEEMKAYNEERKERENELLTMQMSCLSAYFEVEQLQKENKQLQEQLNSANAGNVNCSGCELVEVNAVKEFAEKLKNHPPKNTKTIYWDYGAGWDDCWHAVKVVVDELLKEYEK